MLARRDRAGAARLGRELGDPPVILVPGLGGDVHGIEGLSEVGSFLFGAVSGGRG
jgi:hypothetical protein